MWLVLGGDAVDGGPGVDGCHAGHSVAHQHVLDGVCDGGIGRRGDPAGLAQMVSICGADIALCGPVRGELVRKFDNGRVGPARQSVRDNILLSGDVVDPEPVSHGLQLVVEESGVVNGVQGLVWAKDDVEGGVVNAEKEVGVSSNEELAFVQAVKSC